MEEFSGEGPGEGQGQSQAPPQNITISATPEHPFYVAEKHAYIAASDLAIDSRLETSDGNQVLLIGKCMNREIETVYNLKIGCAHNYYVTKGLLLVHNADYRDAAKRLIDLIVRELRLTKGQRRILHDEITRKNYTEDEIWEITQEIIKLFPNK